MRQQMPITTPLLSALASTLLALLLVAPVAQAEFILFPSLTATEHAGNASNREDMNAALNLFYSADKGRLRLLAEVFISNDAPLDHVGRYGAGTPRPPHR